MLLIIMIMMSLVNTAYSFSGSIKGIITCKAAYREIYSGIDVFGCANSIWSNRTMTIKEYFQTNRPDDEIVSIFYDERSNRFFIYYK